VHERVDEAEVERSIDPTSAERARPTTDGAAQSNQG
jgi:hypothetical protein